MGQSATDFSFQGKTLMQINDQPKQNVQNPPHYLPQKIKD